MYTGRRYEQQKRITISEETVFIVKNSTFLFSIVFENKTKAKKKIFPTLSRNHLYKRFLTF